jgi:hypothetical protein
MIVAGGYTIPSLMGFMTDFEGFFFTDLTMGGETIS